MLTKLATIPEIDEFGFTRVIPFGTRGQGLEKYAGLPDGVQKYIDRHHKKESDGKVGVLLVAMGATEYWGQNCFPTGTPVRTSEGEVPIESVKPGDFVLTHRNRYQEVLSAGSRIHEEGLTQIWCTGLPRLQPVLSATPNHELWIVPKEEVDKQCTEHFYFRRDPVSRKRPVAERRAEMVRHLEFLWRPISELKVGDHISEPFPVEEVNGLGAEWDSPDIAFLCGVYAAEGCVFKRYGKKYENSPKVLAGVILTLGKHETKFADEVMAAIHRLGRKAGRFIWASEIRITISWGSFADLCANHIGTDSVTKKLSDAILSMPRAWQQVFFKAYRRGDGYKVKARKAQDSIRCSSASVELLRGMRLLLARFGIVGSINGRHNRKSGFYCGNPIYELFVGGNQLKHEGKSKPKSYIHPLGFLLSRVSKTIKKEWAGVVYNLHVNQDNSYTTCGISVHNSNGDIFYEPSLVHVPPNWSDDPDSDVVLSKGWGWGYPSFYNAKSFAHHCFPAGTPVLMSDRERKPIELVQPGDKVVTPSGSRSVMRVFRREYTGPGVKLRLQGEPEPLIGTADHPVLVYRRSQIHCPHKYNRLSDRKGCYCDSFRDAVGSPEWAPLSSIKAGDYLVSPVPRSGSHSVSFDFAELVGWVASEGYLHPARHLQFTFAGSGPDIPLVVRCLAKNGLSVKKYPRPQYGNTLSLDSTLTHEMFDRLSALVWGVKADKHISGSILNWTKYARLHFLGPFIDGDGYIPPDSKSNSGQLRIRSSSPAMRHVLRDIIRSMSIPATIQIDSHPHKMLSPTNGKWYDANSSGVVTVTPIFSRLVASYSRKLQEITPGHVYSIENPPEGFLVRVRKAEPVELDELVYNLEVVGDHVYVANEVLVHNCNKSPERSVGDISYVTWDPLMHWVLLVISFDAQRCHKFNGDWMLERLASGRSIPFSMGCRVPFDLSSTSPDEDRYLQVWNSFDPSKYKTPAEAILAEHGRKPIYGLSRTRRDYPQELLYNMGTILSDGRKIGAINDFPNFFDISGVGVPADPTAWSIMKLGSTHCELSGAKCSGSCKHGACRKYATPGVVLWDQMEEQMSKAASVHEASIGKGGDVRKAADIDKETRPQVQASSPVDPEDPDLPKDLLNRMGQDLPLDQSLSTPSLMGMVLKPREFRRIVMVHMGKRDLADKLDDAKTDLPRVLDSESPCSMDSESFNDILGPILSEFMDHRSCLGPVLGRVKITIIKAEPKGGSEPKDEPELQRKVASLYNGYRKIVLEKIGNVKQVVATRPWLHNAIFGVDFLNKTGSLSGTLVPLVTPQTLRYLRG